LKYWTPLKLEMEIEYHWEIGPLDLWIKKIGNEWLLTHKLSNDKQDEYRLQIAVQEQKPQELIWNRYICPNQYTFIQLEPSSPDRAVIFGSELPLKIFPKSSSLLFASIPIWLRIYAGKKKESMLTEIPTSVLSNTWFGDPLSGELCYNLKTKARRSIQELNISPHRIVCPVFIENKSFNPFDFQQLCIHVENLKIYMGKNHLLTGEVHITIYGEEQISQVSYPDYEPSIEKGCKLLCNERVKVDKSILKKSFSLLKYFTNF